MARNVNLWVTGITATGNSVPVPQYEIELTAQWIANDGTAKERTETVRFPNILAQVPAAWLKEHLTELLIDAARQVYGVDE